MHRSLRPKTSMMLLAAWGAVCLIVAINPGGGDAMFFMVGAGLGLCGGIIQLAALRQASASLVKAQTMMDVRRALSSSRFGRLYLYMFWASMLLLIVLLAVRSLLGQVLLNWLAGYASFCFVRELLTLRGAFELERLSSEQPRN